MRTILALSIILCMIASPAFSELTDADLNKIRLIVNEEITKELAKELAPIKADIAQIKVDIAELDTRLRGVEVAVASLTGRMNGVEGRIGGIEKQIVHATNVTYGLMALIIVAIGIPAWRGKSDRDQDRKIDELRAEIETLKRQKVVTP